MQIASFTLDYFGLGAGGIQSAQILGILTSILIFVMGASLAWFSPDKQFALKDSLVALFGRIANLQVKFWALMGFTITYLFLFILPVFFDSSRRIRYFFNYLPDKYPIGSDLSITMNLVESWVRTHQSPYPQEFYPPLAYILQAPLVLVRYPASYALITFLSIVSFFLLAWIVTKMQPIKGDHALAYLFIFSGLFSYGFQFELERGQFNLIAFFLCLLSIYIFHKHYEFRYLAYLLFSFSVHLKIYPAIFFVMFIIDWRDWKANLKRLAGLALFNFALLFVLGYKAFLGFMGALLNQLNAPGWTWNGNHSIHAFVFNFMKDGYGFFTPAALARLQANAVFIEGLLLFIFLACFFSILLRNIAGKKLGLDPDLLLVCTLGALIVPTSNDYTLPVLVAPIVLFLNSITLKGKFGRKAISILFLLVLSVAYFSLLYPFKYRPEFLNSSFPALFTVLISATALAFLLKSQELAGESQSTLTGRPNTTS